MSKLPAIALLLAAVACDEVKLATPIVGVPSRLRPGRLAQATFRSINGPLDSTAYVVEWGDGTAPETSATCRVGQACSLVHTYTDSGDFEVRALAWDGEVVSPWSGGHPVAVRNWQPGVPRRPAGPDSVVVGDTAAFVTICYHPLLEPVSFQFDWGDSLGDYGPLEPQGSQVVTRHAWTRPGSFAVRARARDSTGAESGWSAGAVVVVTGRSAARPLHAGPPR